MKVELDWSKIVKLDIFIHPEMGIMALTKKKERKSHVRNQNYE